MTTKEDKRFHGFGMQSIRMLTEKYGGDLRLRASGGIRERLVSSLGLPSFLCYWARSAADMRPAKQCPAFPIEVAFGSTKRTVKDVYSSDEDGNKAEGAGKHLTIEMAVKSSEASPFAYIDVRAALAHAVEPDDQGVLAAVAVRALGGPGRPGEGDILALLVVLHGYMTMNMMFEHGGYFAAFYPICEAYLNDCVSDEMTRTPALRAGSGSRY